MQSACSDLERQFSRCSEDLEGLTAVLHDEFARGDSYSKVAPLCRGSPAATRSLTQAGDSRDACATRMDGYGAEHGLVRASLATLSPRLANGSVSYFHSPPG